MPARKGVGRRRLGGLLGVELGGADESARWALEARAELKHEGLDDVETGSTAGLEVGDDEVVVIMLSGDGGESPSGDDDEFGEAVEVHYG